MQRDRCVAASKALDNRMQPTRALRAPSKTNPEVP